MSDSVQNSVTVSAVITCFNEEPYIQDCIESLLWCDEIIVVDSFSTDRTPEIAQSYDKVRFLQRTYYGSASQKNWAMDQATGDWLIVLDSDERCTEALRDEIKDTLAGQPRYHAYQIRRLSSFMGKRIRFSGWQNDYVVRFIKKGAGRCPNTRVAGGIVPDSPPGTLKQPMTHFAVDDLAEYSQRVQRYAYWGAAQAWKDNKKSGVKEVFWRSFGRFARTYLLQQGFRDGMYGLVLCLMQAYGTYLKWSILWAWHQQAQRGITPILPEFDEDQTVWQQPLTPPTADVESSVHHEPLPVVKDLMQHPSTPSPASTAQQNA